MSDDAPPVEPVPIEPISYNGTRFFCPGCDEQVDVDPAVVGQLVRCPYCNAQFFASDEHSHLTIVDDTPDHPDGGDDELDMRRVARAGALKRAAIRTQSYWRVGQIGGLIGIFVFAGKAFGRAAGPGHGDVAAAICLAVAAAMAWVAWCCRKRVRLLQPMIDTPTLTDPTDPPDFTTLSDGRDRWKDLEHIR